MTLRLIVTAGTCTTTDGSVANSEECTCGTKECDAGYFCALPHSSEFAKCLKQAIGLDDLLGDFDANWCSAKPTTGKHTLARGSTCIMTAEIRVASGTLILSSGTGNDAMAVLSGPNNNRLFAVSGTGEIFLIDIILECVMQNYDVGEGGAIHATSAKTQLTRSIIRNCEAELGGAVYAKSGAVVILEDSTLESNNANKASGSGGGVYATGAKIQIKGISSIKNNVAISKGGGFYLQNKDTTLEIIGEGTQLVMEGNTAADGGGVYAIGNSKIMLSSAASMNVTNNKGRFNQFLDPNTSAIKHVLTFSFSCSLIFYIVIFFNVIFSIVIFFHRHLLHRQWLIPKSTRPSLDLRSPSAATTRGGGFYLQDLGTRFDAIHDETKLFIKSNTAQTNGGGMALVSGAVVRITAPTTFHSNTAINGNGGGIAYDDVGAKDVASTYCTKVSLNIFLDGDDNVKEGTGVTLEEKVLKIYTTPTSPLSSINQRDDIAEANSNKITSECVPCGEYTFHAGTGSVGNYVGLIYSLTLTQLLLNTY